MPAEVGARGVMPVGESSADMAVGQPVPSAWNATDAPFSESATLGDLVAESVRADPDAVALDLGGGVGVTYAELWRRATAIAGSLAAAGIGAGDHVAVLAEASADAVAAVLGTSLSGAAYVPLDPRWPPPRLAEPLAALRIRRILVTGATAAQAAEAARLVAHDVTLTEACEPGPGIAHGALPGELPARIRPAAPTDAAYVIFTSGSTGTPKGVVVGHRSAVNLVEWVNRTYAIGPGDRVLRITAMSFDLSVYDLFGILAAGAAMRVLDDAELEDPDRILQVLDSEPITFWNSAPTALTQVLAVAGRHTRPAAPSLRLVFLSGDWVPTALPGAVRDRYPGAKVVALGGPTETTVWSNFFEVGEVDPAWPSIPYGRPIQNARCHVLGDGLVPRAIGEPGELYVAGAPVACGYAADEALTAQRFLKDPFAMTPGERMYRTGDRVRWLPGGVMEFLGRTDDQVKIRGYRVELGDVRAALLRIPGVLDAAPLASPGSDGAELIAAVATEAELEPADLSAQLACRLPAYLVPSRFLVLRTLPMTANGKVDRAALQALFASAAGDAEPEGTGQVDPVLRAVRDVVGRDDVSAGDRFILAGGHSLSAARLRVRLAEATGAHVRVSEILGAASIAELAALVAGRTSSPAPAHDRGDSADEFPVSHAQARALYESDLSPDVPAYQNQIALWLPGSLDREEVATALAAVVAAHPMLRSSYRPGPRGWRALVGEPWTPEVECVDLRERGGTAALGSALREHSRIDWDVRAGRLVSWRLFRVDSDRLVLSQIEHHLVHDGWSLSVLLDGFLRALAGLPVLREGCEPARYADYAAAERELVATASDDPRFREYVGALVGGPAVGVAPLPDLGPEVARPGPSDGDAVSVLIDRADWSELRRWASDRGATGFELLLAAFLATLGSATGENDLVVGSAVSARPPGFEQTLGMFVNTVAVRCRREPVFADLMGAASASMRLALDAELLPYDVALARVREQEASRRASLYRCMFSAHDTALPQPKAPGGPTLLEYRQNGTAKAALDVLVLPKQAGADPLAPPGSVRVLWEFDASSYSVALVRDLAEAFASGLHAFAGELRAGAGTAWCWPARRPELVADPGTRRDLDLAITPRGSARPAIYAGGAVATHEDLAALVAAAGYELDEAGVGAGDVVALDVAAGVSYCARVLACLAHEAVVMPVDPAGPAQRLSAALAAAGYRWATSGSLARLPSAAETRPGAAYVVHTSGSTGVPKRVTVSRSGLAAYCAAFGERLRLTSADVVAGANSLLFDAFFEELLPIAAAGGAVALLDLADGVPGLMEQVEHTGATVLDLPTALWTALADHLERRGVSLPSAVRAVVVGGEAYDPGKAARFVRRHGGALRMLSFYGPAECGISVAVHEVTGAEPATGLPQLGAPFAGAALCVLGDGGIVAPGRVGVLGISGPVVAPDLVGVHAVAGIDGAVYPTGDLARLRHDGALEFLGRADHELKVRGFRVAPEEIERAAGLAGIGGGVAAAGVRDGSGAMRLGLVAVASTADAKAFREQARAALGDLLPGHMVPDVVVPVDDLPVTRHGKVDRARVRELLAERVAAVDSDATPARTAAFAPAPRSAVQRAWSAALGPDAPRDTDFRSAGGDSMSVMRFAAALEDELGVRLKIRQIVRARNCADLERVVAAADAGTTG